MKKKTKESERLIEAVLKALDVLDCFGNDPVLTLKQIMERTELGRSRTMRLTGTLLSRGYLFHDHESGQYSLGSRLMALGNTFNRNNTLIRIVRPTLKYLVEKTGESSTFSIIEAGERVILVREESRHAIRYTIQEGQRVPLHAGAASKVLLAFGSKETLEDFLDNQELQQMTSTTITDPDVLLKELTEIRKQGFAISHGENTFGAHAIAVPVFSSGKHLVGAISVSGPSNRIEKTLQDSILDWLFEGAKSITKAL